MCWFLTCMGPSQSILRPTQFAAAVQGRTHNLGIKSVLSPAHRAPQRRPLISMLQFSSWQKAAANLAFLSSSPSPRLELSCRMVQCNSTIYHPICRVTEVPVPLVVWFSFSSTSVNKFSADDHSPDNETTMSMRNCFQVWSKFIY